MIAGVRMMMKRVKARVDHSLWLIYRYVGPAHCVCMRVRSCQSTDLVARENLKKAGDMSCS
jgi:hypothetical protein